jgi:hypothetical protein
MAAMKLFDYLNCIMWTKENLDFTDPEIEKGYDVFIINRFLSMIEIYVSMINMININPMPSKKHHYEWLRSVLPKAHQKINYIKKGKPEGEEAIAAIARFYEVGKKEATIYTRLLKKEEIEEIINIFKDGKDGKNFALET